MKIRFKDVGRHKMSWTAEIEAGLSEEDLATALCMSVEKNGRLMSRGIGVSYDDDLQGTVLAGFRPVGTFGPLEEENERQTQSD